MSTATLTSKGQTTIPVDIRNGLGLQTGDQIEFHLRSDGTASMRVKRGTLKDFIGVLPKSGQAQGQKKRKRPLTLKEMDAGIADTMRAKHGDKRK